MDKAYQGKREDGKWEQFMWNDPTPPTTEETGYVEIEEVGASTI